VRLRRRLLGRDLPDIKSSMSSQACAIAVSEMVGQPLDVICNYVLVVAVHPSGAGDDHVILVMPDGSEPDWPAVRELLGHAEKSLR
jgi:hypothetical protein